MHQRRLLTVPQRDGSTCTVCGQTVFPVTPSTWLARYLNYSERKVTDTNTLTQITTHWYSRFCSQNKNCLYVCKILKSLPQMHTNPKNNSWKILKWRKKDPLPDPSLQNLFITIGLFTWFRSVAIKNCQSQLPEHKVAVQKTEFEDFQSHWSCSLSTSAHRWAERWFAIRYYPVVILHEVPGWEEAWVASLQLSYSTRLSP